jgi:protein-S-isoprenylcysteine O-methyltransferase Ste14
MASSGNQATSGRSSTRSGEGRAFRSSAGVLLAALLVPVVLARIRAEEKLLRTHFGGEYEAYRARTAKLIPRLY